MKKVIMTFDENDNPTIKVEGCTGAECAALTADLEKSLGSVKTDTKTKEFYQTVTQDNKIKI